MMGTPVLVARYASGHLAALRRFACGITVLQVAANPLAAVLGPPEQAHFRLTFSQAFNSLGTFIGPYLGAFLFLMGIEVKEGTLVTAAARKAVLKAPAFLITCSTVFP